MPPHLAHAILVPSGGDEGSLRRPTGEGGGRGGRVDGGRISKSRHARWVHSGAMSTNTLFLFRLFLLGIRNIVVGPGCRFRLLLYINIYIMIIRLTGLF